MAMPLQLAQQCSASSGPQEEAWLPRGHRQQVLTQPFTCFHSSLALSNEMTGQGSREAESTCTWEILWMSCI